MFVAYALATGMSLACIGLYQEVAKHRRWSRPSKWWGSLALGIATFAGVTVIADQVSPVGLIATCSCAILALSIHGQNPVDVEDTYVIEELASEIEQEPEFELVAAPKEESSVELSETPIYEADELVLEEPVEAVVVSAEWLNEVIAEGFIAKSTGDYMGAVDAFQRAMCSCTDIGLSDLLNEELSDCYRNLPELKQGA